MEVLGHMTSPDLNAGEIIRGDNKCQVSECKALNKCSAPPGEVQVFIKLIEGTTRAKLSSKEENQGEI